MHFIEIEIISLSFMQKKVECHFITCTHKCVHASPRHALLLDYHKLLIDLVQI